MGKPIVLLICIALAVQVRTNAIKNPYDLEQQITEQLNQLTATVQGNILSAHNQISISQALFLINSNNVIMSGTEKIQLESVTLDDNVNQLKELAHGLDYTVCITVKENNLIQLLASYTTSLRDCVFDANSQEADIKQTISYRIDIQYTNVQSFWDQVSKCNGNILCLQPILTQIELAKTRLPQNIKTELITFDDFLSKLEVTVQQCSDSNVAEYISVTSSIYQDMVSCVNDLLG